MTLHLSNSRRPITTRLERELSGYAASRQAYDARRRRRITDPVERRAFADYGRLVRGDPCSYCGGFCGQMAADHIVPLEHGGENLWDNLTAAGRPCNASKKDKPLLIWMLERPPVAASSAA